MEEIDDNKNYIYIGQRSFASQLLTQKVASLPDEFGEPMMHGGAKRTTQLNMGWFESVMHMLKHAEEIECISYSSLKGFVFRVTLSYDLHVGDFMYKVGDIDTIYKVIRIEKRGNDIVYFIQKKEGEQKEGEQKEGEQKEGEQKEVKIQLKYDKTKGYVDNNNNNNNIYKSVNPFQSITAGSTGKIDKTLEKILIKFTLLTSNSTNFNLQKYNGRIKQTDTVSDFKNEVINQINIFKNTYKNGKLAICPSILYDRACTVDESTIFLDIFNTLHGLTQRGKNVTKYLQRMILLYNSTYYIKLNLGMIFMEYADSEPQTGNKPGFILFEELYYRAIKEEENINTSITTSPLSEKQKQQQKRIKSIHDYLKKTIQKSPTTVTTNIIILHRIALILSNMIVLLYQTGIVHCDLHVQNVFVKDFSVKFDDNDPCQILDHLSLSNSCIRIIDFGRINQIEQEPTAPITFEQIDAGIKIELHKILKDIQDIQDNIFKESNFITYNDELLQTNIKLKSESTDNRQTRANKQQTQNTISLKEILLLIVEVLRFIFETDLTYNLNYGSDKPQCMYLFKISGLDTFFDINSSTSKVTLKLNILDDETNIHPQIYVLTLVAKYIFNYFNAKQGNEPDEIYKGSQEENITADKNFEQSFQGQLLRFQLEQLKNQLDIEDEDKNIEPIAVESYQLDDNGKKRFDLFDNTGQSIRTKEPGLKGLFQSIDDIIGME